MAADGALVLIGAVGAAVALQGAAYAFVWPVLRAVYGVTKLPRTWRSFCLASRLTIETEQALPTAGHAVKLTAIKPSDRQLKLGFALTTLDKDLALRSLELDNALSGHDWSCELADSHAQLVRATIVDNRDFCLAFLTRAFEKAWGQSLFVNQRKWCLASEPDTGAGTVQVHEGGYFDSFCTNEGCTAVLVDEKGDKRRGLRMFPVHMKGAGTLHLDDLELAPVNNHVGITTLAITADRYIVVWQQGQLNTQDPGKIVATGSGSGDIGDLEPASLRTTVVRGMERELREEGIRNGVLLPRAAVAHTEIVGFFRWIARGGKPEFVGITRLSISVDQLWPDHREVYEPVPAGTQRKLESKIFVAGLDVVPAAIASIRAYEGRGGQLSLPLKVILARMDELFALRPDFLRSILFGN